MERALSSDDFQDKTSLSEDIAEARHVHMVSPVQTAVDSKHWFDVLYHPTFYACHKNLPVFYFNVQLANNSMFCRFNTDCTKTIFKSWEDMYGAFLEQNGPLLGHEPDHFALWRLARH